MPSKQRVFLDTSVFSAYFDERQSERMALTQEFWRKLKDFDTYTSEVTKQELEATTDPTKQKQFRRLLREIKRSFAVGGFKPLNSDQRSILLWNPLFVLRSRLKLGVLTENKNP